MLPSKQKRKILNIILVASITFFMTFFNESLYLACAEGTSTTDNSPLDLALWCNVQEYGAKGDGLKDDTKAIQEAINYVYSIGGGTVYIPDGIYLVNPDTSIHMKNGITLRLSENATLKAKPSANGSYAIIEIYNNSDVSICGGSIVGERYTHLGITGDSGRGIEVWDSSNITIKDISISDCWGDGIYLGTNFENGYNSNIDIERFICSNNRRHGIAVISAKNLTIEDGVCCYTNGASSDTRSGLDLEPNYDTQILQNISIENLQTIDNGGYGLDFWLGTNYTAEVPISNVSVTIINHTDRGSVYGTLHDIKRYISKGYDITVL
jgi:Endopolygalacturonase